MNFTLNSHVLITGASGMVGGEILRLALASDRVSWVTTLGRRELPIKSPKLRQIIVTDFLDYSQLAESLVDVTVCFYCLGVYTGDVSPDLFRTIMTDYPVAFARAFKIASPNATFVLLSGQGADRTEKSRVMFCRDRGAAENGVLAQHFPKTLIFRPGYIYPSVPRKEPNRFYAVMRYVYPIFLEPFFVSAGVRSSQLAEVMVAAAFSSSESTTYENAQIRKF